MQKKKCYYKNFYMFVQTIERVIENKIFVVDRLHLCFKEATQIEFNQ